MSVLFLMLLLSSPEAVFVTQHNEHPSWPSPGIGSCLLTVSSFGPLVTIYTLGKSDLVCDLTCNYFYKFVIYLLILTCFHMEDF